MGADLTLLHTAAGHVARFEALRQRLAPEVEVRHVVHEALLRAATGEDGITPEVRGRVTEEVRALSAGSRVVLCTCSTLGGIAEALDGAYGARVVRVDRPMARRAVEAGSRVALIASLASTLGPTEALLREEAGRAGRTLELDATVVPGAWELFEAGEQEAYLQAVAAHADARSAGADAVVLAQASMDGAERLARTAVPVLSSPATGLLHALELLSEPAAPDAGTEAPPWAAAAREAAASVLGGLPGRVVEAWAQPTGRQVRVACVTAGERVEPPVARALAELEARLCRVMEAYGHGVTLDIVPSWSLGPDDLEPVRHAAVRIA